MLYLADVGDFNEGLVGLLVLVQLHGDVSAVRWPLLVKNAQSHETGDEGGVVSGVQEQLPVGGEQFSGGRLEH